MPARTLRTPPTAFTSPPARPLSPWTAGISTSAGTAPRRAGPSMTGSWPSGSPTADGSPSRPRTRVPTSPSTSCCWPTSAIADAYYVKNGKPTVEPGNIRLALRPLRQLYGHTPAREFGPLALKAVRQAMIDAGLCRIGDQQAGRPDRPGVQVGRRGGDGPAVRPSGPPDGPGPPPGPVRRSRESEPVKPVPEAFVDAIRPHVSRQVWAMVELQRLTGMRPGEVCSMRTSDLDTLGPGLGSTRPRATRPSITAGSGHLSRPAGPSRPPAVAPGRLSLPVLARRRRWPSGGAEHAAARKTPVQPSQQNRAKAAPRKVPGTRYTVESYRRAIANALQAGPASRAGIRTSSATTRRPGSARSSAWTSPGPSSAIRSPVVTEVYAELDGAKAAEAMGRVG